MTKLVQIECAHANPKLTSLFVSAVIVIVDKGAGDGTFLRRHHKRGVYLWCMCIYNCRNVRAII